MNGTKEYCTKEGKWIPAVKVGDPGDWGEHEKDTYYCPDCTAGKGEYHKRNCDVERCPVCGGQLMTCGCFDELISRQASDPVVEANPHRRKYRVWDCNSKSYRDGFLIDGSGNIYILDNGSLKIADPNRFRIERCTGQKDQFGTLVYENDIADVYNPLTDSWNECQVIWEDDAAGWVCEYTRPENIKRGCHIASSSGTYFEGSACVVKTNVHEVNNG